MFRIPVEQDYSLIPMVLADGKIGNPDCNCRSFVFGVFKFYHQPFLAFHISGMPFTASLSWHHSATLNDEVFPSLAAYFWHPTALMTRAPYGYRRDGLPHGSFLCFSHGFPWFPWICGQDTRSGGRAGPYLFQPFHQHGQSGHDGGAPRLHCNSAAVQRVSVGTKSVEEQWGADLINNNWKRRDPHDLMISFWLKT